jgi:hypothetical protein
MSEVTPGNPIEPPVAPTPAAPAVIAAAPSNTMGVLALVFGLLSFVCIPFIGAILAIVFGRIGMKKASQGLATNGGVAKAGFWIGIIGLIFAVLGFIFWVVIFIVAAKDGTLVICGIEGYPACTD